MSRRKSQYADNKPWYLRHGIQQNRGPHLDSSIYLKTMKYTETPCPRVAYNKSDLDTLARVYDNAPRVRALYSCVPMRKYSSTMHCLNPPTSSSREQEIYVRQSYQEYDYLSKSSNWHPLDRQYFS